MSMKDIPCSGYTVKASEFTNLLPGIMRDAYAKALEERDVEKLHEILEKHLPSTFPDYESLFMLSDEDNAENLERETVYVIFQDEDLYHKVLTDQATTMMKTHGIIPQFNRWTNWG